MGETLMRRRPGVEEEFGYERLYQREEGRTVPEKKAPATYGPEAGVIGGGQGLSGLLGGKGRVTVEAGWRGSPGANPGHGLGNVLNG